MNYREIFDELCRYAPISLSDELVKLEDGYDNSGVILGNDGDISSILFALDLTKGAVEEAIDKGCKLIVTHHPAIYRPIKKLDENSPLCACARNGIAVISMHLNLDCAKEGIDYYLARGLGGEVEKIIQPLGENVGYGRVSSVEKTTAKGLLDRYKKTFETERAWLYGDEDAEINKIASFCGSGLDEAAVFAAKKEGADIAVSADVPHHVLLLALENGLSVLSCTHYACENYGFKKFYEAASEIFNQNKIYFYRDEVFAR